MSIPNEALQKLIQEIESQAQQSYAQIQTTRQAIQLKQNNERVIELTAGEIRKLPADTKCYEGVGKMFVQQTSKEALERMEKEQKELKDDRESLGKKLEYYEKTFEKSKENINMILGKS